VTARIVVLASGSGSTLQAVLDAAASGELPATIMAAGSDRPGCLAMKRAADAGIETFELALKDFADRPAWDAAFADRIATYQPDLVVLAGFMRIFSAETIGRFRMVNTHPALSPAFPGAHAVRDALAHGVKVSGVTIHWVDAGVDTGPIIAQAAVPVEAGDTEDSLRDRIQAVEKPLYVKTISEICRSFEEPDA
jgi:formyltetrahydrofolate-dependent phosphoribosylglycinamide formyltransferase